MDTWLLLKLVETSGERNRVLFVMKSRGMAHSNQLREFEITGPFNVTGVSDTPTRRKVFSCRPVSAGDELPCATKIIKDLARQAFRRPATSEDMESLMSFYHQGRETDFESGIRMALQAILASPEFLFRLEREPSDANR